MNCSATVARKSANYFDEERLEDYPNVDGVVHTAAKAGVWGDWDDYFAINKRATDSIIAACLASSIRNLVFLHHAS